MSCMPTNRALLRWARLRDHVERLVQRARRAAVCSQYRERGLIEFKKDHEIQELDGLKAINTMLKNNLERPSHESVYYLFWGIDR